MTKEQLYSDLVEKHETVGSPFFYDGAADTALLFQLVKDQKIGLGFTQYGEGQVNVAVSVR